MTRSWLLFSVYLCCLPALVFCNQPESTSVSNKNVARILSLLRSGEEKLNFAGSEDVILVLENTGSGKSTFTQLLAGNNDELVAKFYNSTLKHVKDEELESEIVDTITSDMARLNRLIVHRFRALEREMLEDDMYSLRELLSKASEVLARISSVNESASVENLVSHMRKNLPELCLSASKSILDDMANLVEFYDFLQQVNDKKVKPMTKNCISELQPAINYVENSLNWYDFLAALHQRFSEYDIQRDTQRFLPLVPELGSEPRSLGSIANFTDFFNQISDLDFLKKVNFKGVQKINIDGTKVKYFERVVSSSLQSDRNFEIQRGSVPVNGTHLNGLIASGEYVMLSDALQHLQINPDHSLLLLAKHTVFIDVDVTKSIDVSIIAPRWVVVGSRTINLNGSPGREHASIQAPDGVENEGYRNGEDGKPGNPGESAGHFFGIGQVFKNIENLTITAYGSAGGRGGAGGMGGNVGSITVLANFTEQMGVTKPSFAYKIDEGENSNYGLHGRCGSGGQGGGHPNEATIRFGKTKTPDYSVNTLWNEASAADGETGVVFFSQSSFNFKNRQEPVPKTLSFPLSSVISYFRNELIPNFGNSVTKRQALKFYQTLQTKEIIQHDNAELIYQELTTLEAHYNKLDPSVNWLLYNLLLQRIREQFKTVQNETQSENRKLLEFLSAVVHSQFIRMNNKLESRQVSNLQAYFDVMKSDFDVMKLGDLFRIRFFSRRAIDEVSSVYNFVHIIKGDIFDTIERTANEIIELSNKNSTHQLGDKLLKFKVLDCLKTVGDFLWLCGDLAGADVHLDNALDVISALPSVLTTTAFETYGGHILNDLNVMEESFEKYIEAVQNSVLKERTTLKAQDMEYDKICDQLRKAEEDMKYEKSLLTSEFNNTVCAAYHGPSDSIQRDRRCHRIPEADGDLLSRKSPLASKLYDYRAYFATSRIVQSLLDLNKQLLKDHNVAVQNTADKFVKDLKLMQFSTRLHERFLKQDVDSSGVISFIENIQKDGHFVDKAARVDEIVSELFNLMGSIGHEARNWLTNSLYEPKDQKEVREMVTQTLNNVKLQLLKLVTQFEIDEDLQLTMENINEAVDDMVSIYNGVLVSQHDRGLLRSFYKYLKHQSELGNSKHEFLIEVVKANSLFYDYERLLDMYKKYVSPLNATLSVIPSAPVVYMNDTVNRSIIEYNIAIMEFKLKSLAENTSSGGITEEFSSANQRGAFFTWKSHTYKESISRLLRGRKVALKATLADKNFQFLRLNNIKLIFKSNDSTIQPSLNEDFSNFKVIMTHLGRSYFHLCGHTRLINQVAVTFVLSANQMSTEVEDENVNPVVPILSPYTTWIFQLEPINKNVSFDSLLPYRKAEISIELEGNATYFDSKNDFFCENILRDEPNSDASSGSSTEPSELVQKRRESTIVDSSLSVGLFEDHTDPGFEHSTPAFTETERLAEFKQERMADWTSNQFNYD